MAENIVLDFTSNTKELDSAISKVQALGAADKANAAQFAKSNTEFIDFAKKREIEIQKEIAHIERLRILRKQSFNVEDIKFYNKEIALAKTNIQALGGAYQTVGSGAKALLKEQVALNAALKQGAITAEANSSSLASVGKGATKAFGALRTLANIIPGIGISGLILFGYEALIGLFEEFTSSLGDNEVALKGNKEAIDKLIDSRDALIRDIDETKDAELVALGKLTDAEAKKRSAQRDFDAEEKVLNAERIERIKELGRETGLSNAKIAEDEAKAARVFGGSGQAEEAALASKKTEQARKTFGAALLKFDEEQAVNRALIKEKLEAKLSKIETDSSVKSKGGREKSGKDQLTDEEKLAELIYQANVKLQQQILDLQADTEEKKLRREADKQIQAINASKADAVLKAEAVTSIEIKLIDDLDNIKKKKEEDAAKERLKAQKEESAESLRILEEELDEAERLEKERQANNKELRLTVEQGVLDTIADINNAALDNEMERNQEFRDNELESLQAQLDNKQITQEQFAAKSNEINKKFDEEAKIAKRKAAETDKLLSIFNIIVKTAEAVAANLEFPPLAAAIGVLGAAQLAIITSTPIPKFAKGTKSVQGGIQGTDSVHALVMPGEMIIPTDKKNRYEPILNAIFDEKISPDLLNNLALSGKMNFGQSKPIDEYAISDAMDRSLRKGLVIKNFPKPNDTISYSELALLKRNGII